MGLSQSYNHVLIFKFLCKLIGSGITNLLPRKVYSIVGRGRLDLITKVKLAQANDQTN